MDSATSFDFGETSVVNSERAARGLWLVKVPRYLSEEWQRNEGKIVGRLVKGDEIVFRSERPSSSNSTNISGSSTSRLSLDGSSQYNRQSPLNGQQNNDYQIPTEHKFIMRDLNNQTMAVLCEDKTGLEENVNIRTGKLTIEGRVVKKAECQPPKSREYMKMKARQIQLVSQPKNVVKQMDRAVVKFKPVTLHAEDVAKEKTKKDGAKSVRLERPQVMELLFKAFEKHQYYRLIDLQKITSQPLSLVKEILSDIAVYNTQPPHRATWQLKPEYHNYDKGIATKIESKNKKH